MKYNEKVELGTNGLFVHMPTHVFCIHNLEVHNLRTQGHYIKITE